MKVIFVDKPLKMVGGDKTIWCVQSEMMKLNQTFQQWIIEKWEWVKNRPTGKDVKGFYIYDFMAIAGVDHEGKGIASMMIRYDYIKN